MHRVRTIAPNRVFVVDATQTDLGPGEVRVLDDRFISEQFIITTHDLPVSFLLAALRETVPEVLFLGIQPSLSAFGYPISPAVEQAVVQYPFSASMRGGRRCLALSGAQRQNPG